MKPSWRAGQVAERVVCEILGFDRGFGPNKTLGFVDDAGRVAGGMVFHNWCPEAGVIEITIGSRSRMWATREILRAAAEFAFEDCGCQAVVARTDKNNPARTIWKKLGASEHVIPRLRGRDEAEHILVLPQEAFMNSKYVTAKSCGA